MKKYIDLKIDGAKEYLVNILSKMKSLKNTDFKYESELSNGMALNVRQSIEEVGCFKASSVGLFHSRVYVDIKDKTDSDGYYLWVTNIISSDKDHLSVEEYNKVLREFVKQVISIFVPLEKIQMSKEDVSLKDIISTSSYEALDRWEHLCDHNSPFGHPLDRKRWMEFLSSMYYFKDDENMSIGDLEGWLREDKKWGPYLNNVISDIEMRYEDGIELLHYYNDIFIK